METNTLALKTVKVISQKIIPDWIHPYKNAKTSKSIGSGFFIDNEGHILTCSHVVDDAMKIFIEIPNHGDEKIEVDGILMSRKLLNRETTKRSCPVCGAYSFKIRDDVFMNKFDCCYNCYIQWIEGREDRWKTGWRPE